MSYLVANPEDRFSHNEVQIIEGMNMPYFVGGKLQERLISLKCTLDEIWLAAGDSAAYEDTYRVAVLSLYERRWSLKISN